MSVQDTSFITARYIMNSKRAAVTSGGDEKGVDCEITISQNQSSITSRPICRKIP